MKRYCLKCSSHKKILFASILFFNSVVFSRVVKITLSHSVRAADFNFAVSSPSSQTGKGILNSERLLLRLVLEPYKAQLAPGIVYHRQKKLNSRIYGDFVRIFRKETSGRNTNLYNALLCFVAVCTLPVT